jgi:hypothetical protein
MTTSNIQQAISGFTTVEVIGGPCIVRIHEARDAALCHTKHRYFLSVDFKFRECDALNIGKPGWYGQTKAEAAREAKQLAARIFSTWNAMNSANEHALQWDTFTNRHTAKLQTERFDKVVGRYCAEMEPV